MYAYIYDSFVNTGKYQKELERIEVRLSHFGIQGKIRRLNILHHQKHEIEESIRRGAKTVVLVGNDRTIAQSIDVFAEANVALGIIPLGGESDNRIARVLGIPPGELACEVLSRRRIVRLDLGDINGRYFLTSAELDAPTFECMGGQKNMFRIRPNAEGAMRLSVVNLALPTTEDGVALASNPKDGILEVVLRDEHSALARVLRLGQASVHTPSIFPVEDMHITQPEGAVIALDGVRTVKVPAVIRVAPQKIRVITGRERLFG